MKIASFNVQGLNNKYKQRILADDFIHMDVDIMAIQETKIQKQEHINIKASDGTPLTLYNSGHPSRSWKGVAILVKDSIKISFKPISERICIAQIKNGDSKLNLMSVYSPTNDETVKKPDQTDMFYNKINSVINGINKRDTFIIGGDFNARTKTQRTDDDPDEVVGRYARNNINENGRKLVDFCKMNKLMLTNTMFKHKPSQQVTWESAMYPKGERRNPYRFQIDYIAVRKQASGLKIIDSRAYNGLSITSDHKPVIMKLKSHHATTEEIKPRRKKLNLEDLQIKEVKEKYQEKINTSLQSLPAEQRNKWEVIGSVVKDAAEEIVGFQNKEKEYKNPKIIEASEKQKKIACEINSCTDAAKRLQLKKERNRLLTQLHTELKNEENERLKRRLQPLLTNGDASDMNGDSRNMFNVVKELKRSKPKRKLVMKKDNGMLTTDEAEQAEIIAEHFKTIFYKGAEQYRTITPQKMKIPFTGDDVYNGVARIWNNRCAGIDDVYAELIKYAPESVHKHIAEILNKMAETGQPPREINLGILNPLEKSKLKIGEKENIRPIILLSVLRKILSNIMMQRIRDRLDQKIPNSQSAYRSGRSGTEHVFAAKITVERTLAEKDGEIHIIMLDMSKAFDSINRKTLLEDLSEIIDEDELHIIQLMLNVNLTVRCGDKLSKEFKTDTGGPQGDSSSANEFTFYLSKALLKYYNLRETTKVVKHHHLGDHQYYQQTDEHMEDHQYNKKAKKGFEIDLQYADDLSELNTNLLDIDHLKAYLPQILKERDLILNQLKEEGYTVSAKHHEWKKCKLLGSYIDTEKDIANRKRLVINAANNLDDVFKNKNISINTKVFAFIIYLAAIFLYNSELWTLTESQLAKIDSFHRKLIRTYILNVKYPKIVTNKELYEITKIQPWSVVIGKRRLSWFGHACRLPEDTPARIALNYALEDYEKKQGRPKQTWLKVVERQLQQIDIQQPLKDVIELAQDKLEWKNTVLLWLQKVAPAT